MRILLAIFYLLKSSTADDAPNTCSYRGSNRTMAATCDDEFVDVAERPASADGTDQPNPPRWPDTVTVFGPEDADISQRMAELSQTLNNHSDGHFSSERRAFLFKPGTYDVDAKIGYYTQVAGLGRRPEDVVFAGTRGVYVDAMDPGQAGSLDTFWRAGENFKHDSERGFKWAVSQAAPLRRIVAAKDLELFDADVKSEDCNYASGGFLADSRVEGALVLGSQQQWLSRNVDLKGRPTGGAWSNVFVGCKGALAPSPAGVEPRVSVVETAPVVAAKPYVAVNADGTYVLRIPHVRRDAAGAGLDAPADEVPFEEVFVADAAAHGSAELQAALDAGLHLVLAPGVYALDAPLRVADAKTVILGLGLASLLAPPSGEPCIIVEDRGGNRLAGVVLQASEVPRGAQPVLLKWGGRAPLRWGSAHDPSVLSDVFCRVGGPGSRKVRADVMVEVTADFVVLDNVWLWRADHAELAPGEQPRAGEQYHLVVPGECSVGRGLVVDGESVVAYGLAVEHTEQDQVQWRGDKGRVYFYQSELPYDVDQAFGDAGWAGYRVGPAVQEHLVVAPGIYSFFRDHVCLVPAAIVAPPSATFMNAFTKHLRGHQGILDVIRLNPPQNLVVKVLKLLKRDVLSWTRWGEA
mmetsp:Transcript_24013/g.72021  ORF Transcript_24013/g.72021 Transcript_24013/m.72021 type:complete len:635 (+) Transcript_24013:239-2143(+)